MFGLLDSYKRLKANGVLGINARNLSFIQEYNSRRYYPDVDSKLRSKLKAQEAGIPVPQLYMEIDSHSKITNSVKELFKYSSFVIKPEHGAGGSGILVLKQKDGKFYKLSGKELSFSDVRSHIAEILSGMYSLAGRPDRAFVEYMVMTDKDYSSISYQGAPDLRILVFKSTPIMAMMRLPTKKSDSKANLHQGAIGLGIDLETGLSTFATQSSTTCQNHLLEYHPDTKAKLSGVQLKNWSSILDYTKQIQEIFKIGYLGVDLVFDQDLGPMLLEVNARPGLSIQMANQKGILSKIKDLGI